MNEMVVKKSQLFSVKLGFFFFFTVWARPCIFIDSFFYKDDLNAEICEVYLVQFSIKNNL